MTYIVKSKTTERKHELIRLFESGKINKEDYESEMQSLLITEKQEIQDAMASLHTQITTVEKKSESIPKKADSKTKNKLYHEAIELYREAEKIFLATRQLKKDIRERLKK